MLAQTVANTDGQTRRILKYRYSLVQLDSVKSRMKTIHGC